MDDKSSLYQSCIYYFGEVDGLNVVVRSELEAVSLHSAGTFGIWIANKPCIGQEDFVNIKHEDVAPYLTLTLEEAFFLSYALGRLFVRCDGIHLDLEALWKLFCKLKANFPFTYAVYHHFRAKGWIPKEGLRYGVDFVLYKQGPSYHHAEYAVVVVPESKETPSKVSWRWMAGLGRLLLSVSKKLLHCNICMTENTTSPRCLESANISSIGFSRWASPKEQEDERDIDVLF